MKLKNYIKEVRASGKYAFTQNEAISKLGITKNAFNCGIYKLKKKKDIISPAKHLYVIVSPEHQWQGCLPAEELIPVLMKHWDVPYYVCGLSAAYYHGASHQKSQIFQVMTNKRLRDLGCGKIKITFSYKKDLKLLYVEKRIVKTGYLYIASPELTALDLLTYSKLAGGLNPTATVLSELIEAMDATRLSQIIESSSEHAWWQRLGYILENMRNLDINNLEKNLSILRQYAKKQKLSWIPLTPELAVINSERDNFWKIIKNTNIEVDE